MKKIILSIVAVALFAFASNAQSNNEQKAVSAARAAVNQACGENAGNQYSVTENFICNNIDGNFGNFNRTVTFYKTTSCPPNQVCIQLVTVIGSAVVDCDYNVVSVTCGGAVTE
jgi:hypothetical protein